MSMFDHVGVRIFCFINKCNEFIDALRRRAEFCKQRKTLVETGRLADWQIDATVKHTKGQIFKKQEKIVRKFSSFRAFL